MYRSLGGSGGNAWLGPPVAQPSGYVCGHDDRTDSLERRGHVLMIGLDRAAKRNAFDSAAVGRAVPCLR